MRSPATESCRINGITEVKREGVAAGDEWGYTGLAQAVAVPWASGLQPASSGGGQGGPDRGRLSHGHSWGLRQLFLTPLMPTAVKDPRDR